MNEQRVSEARRRFLKSASVAAGAAMGLGSARLVDAEESDVTASGDHGFKYALKHGNDPRAESGDREGD